MIRAFLYWLECVEAGKWFIRFLALLGVSQLLLIIVSLLAGGVSGAAYAVGLPWMMLLLGLAMGH